MWLRIIVVLFVFCQAHIKYLLHAIDKSYHEPAMEGF